MKERIEKLSNDLRRATEMLLKTNGELDGANAKIAELTNNLTIYSVELNEARRKIIELQARLAAIDAQPVVIMQARVADIAGTGPGQWYEVSNDDASMLEKRNDREVRRLIAKPASNPDTTQEKQDV